MGRILEKQMADGLYTDTNCFPCRLDRVAEFFLRRGKNRVLLEQPAAQFVAIVCQHPKSREKTRVS